MSQQTLGSVDMQDMMDFVQQMVSSVNSTPSYLSFENSLKQSQQATPKTQNDIPNETVNEVQTEDQGSDSICFPETEKNEFTQEIDNQLSKSFTSTSTSKSNFAELSETQRVFAQSTKTVLAILLLNSVLAAAYHHDVYSLCSVVLNLGLLAFFGKNEQTLTNSIDCSFQTATSFCYRTSVSGWNRCKQLSSNCFNVLLNRLVSKKNQIIFNLMFSMLKSKVKQKLIQMKHDFYNPPVLFDCKNFTTYKLNYYLNGNRYSIPIVHYRGSNNEDQNSILMVLDENGNDITNDIQCYLGPLSNFHGLRLKPQELGLKDVTVLTNDGTEHSLKSNSYFP